MHRGRLLTTDYHLYRVQLSLILPVATMNESSISAPRRNSIVNATCNTPMTRDHQQQILDRNEGLVRHVARRFAQHCWGRALDPEDLHQAGRRALLRAAKTFDLAKGEWVT